MKGKSYFWYAYSFSTLGRFVHGMALSWVVWTLTHSPIWLSAIALLSALPTLPLAPLAGQVADRFHRHKKSFLVTQTLGCCVAAITAFFGLSQPFDPNYLGRISFMFRIISSVDGPALHSMLVESGETVSCCSPPIADYERSSFLCTLISCCNY